MTEEVLFEQRGHLGLITLNRPKALNSLTHEMALAMMDQLTQWQDDDAIAVVAVIGAGEKGFCAGGDIRALYESGQGDKVYSRAFYRDEYKLDRQIKHYPKPYVAILDGIVMGGGVGISVHGSHRVATDKTTFAMPETGIGLFPDVGGSYFLLRLEGRLGMYLGLSGRRLKGADAFHAGVATHYAAQADENAILEALAALSPVDDVAEVLDSFNADAGTPSFAAELDEINRLFAADNLADILQALEADGGAFAQKTLATLNAMSPTSLAVAAQQLTRGATLDFDECMVMEYRIARRFIDGVDFYEGVRATIIDKDGAPTWHPATLAEISQADIDSYFAPLGADELTF